MRRHDMTKKIDKDKYKDKDNDKDKDKDILRTPPKSNPRDLWHLTLTTILTIENNNINIYIVTLE